MSSRSKTGCTMIRPSTFLRLTSFRDVVAAGEVVVEKRHDQVDVVALQHAAQRVVQRAVVEVHAETVEVRGKDDPDGAHSPRDEASGVGVELEPQLVGDAADALSRRLGNQGGIVEAAGDGGHAHPGGLCHVAEGHLPANVCIHQGYYESGNDQLSSRAGPGEQDRAPAPRRSGCRTGQPAGRTWCPAGRWTPS